MAGGKAPPGSDGSLPNDVAAAIDEKQRKEDHWRRSGTIAVEEDDPPLGSHRPAEGEERPPSPLE